MSAAIQISPRDRRGAGLLLDASRGADIRSCAPGDAHPHPTEATTDETSPSICDLPGPGGHREPARTAPYPANTCVGRKQKEAGKYCKAVLRAWSAWDRSQNDRKRDRSLANAAKQLATRWARAEADALGQGTDCAETTLSSGAAQSLIDGAAGGVATAINAGLDLRRAGNARCGSALLNAAALECGRILAAEGAHVRDLQGDADGTARDAARAAASAAFGRAWTAQISAGCPTTAAQADLGSQIDGVTADLVFDTVVSPNVDDTQFTAYPATGTTRYLGRDFTPICMNGSPYYFFAKRGTVNKLVVYYQGGGACWDSLTCGLPSCDATVDPSPTGSDNPNNYHAGFADLANPSNPFRDWNIVFVSYCSCDVHFGDSAKDYPPHVEHRGYQNSRVVEKWAREHFVDPDQVFVTGSSAGAYGAWFNAVLHERVWPASKFEVLADAGNGVITQSFLDNYFPNWNFAANIPTDIPGLTDVLTNGTGIVGYTEVVANFFPRTRWAQYSAAYDGGFGGQTSFYTRAARSARRWWRRRSRPRPRSPRTTATTSGPEAGTRCGAATRSTPTRRAACRRWSTGSTRCSRARRRGPTSSARTAASSCPAIRRPGRSGRRSR